jgi:sialate O-acetylesterase
MLRDSNLSVEGPDKTLIPLDGPWLAKIERRLDPASGKVPPWISGLSHGTYNAMIAPITDYQCRGILWYQGEADAGNERYAEMLEAMCQSWRQKRNEPSLPFYYVQLPNMRSARTPDEHPWARMREIQRQALRIPHSGMVVTIDGPDPDGHPKVKRYIGERLALMARHHCYGESTVEYSGPELRAVQKIERGVRLTFSSQSALDWKEGEPTGFLLSTDGKRYFPAKARVKGNQVELESGAVPAPAWVRYAWEANPRVSLANTAGFPASPFEAQVPSLPKP